MKNRVIQAFSIICIGCLVFGFCNGQEKKENASLTAGIVSNAVGNLDAADDVTVSDSEVVVTASTGEDTYGYKNLGIANVDGNANIREGASQDSSIVGKLPNDAGCEIIDVQGDWTHISSGEVEGYVMSEFLLTGDAAKEKAESVLSYKATVLADVLRVRVAPDTTSEILSTVSKGTDLEIIENQGDWVEVNIDNETGYVSGEFVSCEQKLKDAMTLTEARFGEGVSDGRVELVSFATQFVGNPYVWGGTSLTNGADCSGFVLSVYAKYGIYLPHSSRAQANCGRRISTSELKPGDLLFYGSGGGINHVAMYIGGGQIVHASTPSTGIIISSAFNRSPICCVSLLD